MRRVKKKGSARSTPKTPVVQESLVSYFADTQPLQEKREKVTVSINSSLLDFVDDFVARHADSNRSAVIDHALNLWIGWVYEEQDKAYYTNLTAEQRKERKFWTDVAAESATKIWNK